MTPIQRKQFDQWAVYIDLAASSEETHKIYNKFLRSIVHQTNIQDGALKTIPLFSCLIFTISLKQCFTWVLLSLDTSFGPLPTKFHSLWAAIRDMRINYVEEVVLKIHPQSAPIKALKKVIKCGLILSEIRSDKPYKGPLHPVVSGEGKKYPKRPRYGLRKAQKSAYFRVKWRKIEKGQNFGLFEVFSYIGCLKRN